MSSLSKSAFASVSGALRSICAIVTASTNTDLSPSGESFSMRSTAVLVRAANTALSMRKPESGGWLVSQTSWPSTSTLSVSSSPEPGRDEHRNEIWYICPGVSPVMVCRM